MKVHELITELQKCNPEADVFITCSDGFYMDFALLVDIVPADENVFLFRRSFKEPSSKYKHELNIKKWELIDNREVE